MGMQKFHITLPDLEFNLPSKTKIELNLLLKQYIIKVLLP